MIFNAALTNTYCVPDKKTPISFIVHECLKLWRRGKRAKFTDYAALKMCPFYDKKRLTREKVYKGMKTMELSVGWIQVKTIIIHSEQIPKLYVSDCVIEVLT